MARPALEHEWKALLAARGFAVPRGRVLGADAGVAEAVAGLRAPFAVKALGPRIVHKTELGAVRVGVAPDALPEALAAMRASLAGRGLAPDGFLVEEMAAPGVEMLLGVATDPGFGRLVAFGLGGARVEALGEVRFFAAPLRAFDVETLLASVPGLAGTLARVGGRGPDALRDAIWLFAGPGGVGLDPAIDHLEINPLIVSAEGAVVADARGAYVAC